MSREHSYWLVGANWSGDDQADAFFRRGYWELGWSDEDQPGMAKMRDSIQNEDRIAIKAMQGQGAKTILIKALGIVKEVANKRVYINWLVTDINREVPAKGCFSSIHGSFKLSDKDAMWTREVFCL
jgi:hypothetical protein